jgi:DNA helicase-2/ATP-dependent DNA helicase PcrA
VLHRVEVLADRAEEHTVPPATAGEVSNLVPLAEILAELAGTGTSSKTVERSYDRLVTTLGPELAILDTIPLEDITRAESALLGEAIDRLRSGNVIREAGYDGEYGVIRLFEPAELARHTQGGLLFDLPTVPASGEKARRAPSEPRSAREDAGCAATVAASGDTIASAAKTTGDVIAGDAAASGAPSALLALSLGDASGEASSSEMSSDALPRSAPAPERAPGPASPEPATIVDASAVLAHLDAEQRRAAGTVGGALLIIAGPGSGKTRTLTHRIAHLVAERGVPAAACLAITFTRRAAAELRERLASLLPDASDAIAIHTFHSFGLTILREHPNEAGLQRGFRIAGTAEQAELLSECTGLTERAAGSLLRAISTAKRTGIALTGEAAEARQAYDEALAMRNWIDFDDLIGLSARMLTEHPALAATYAERFRSVSVDEFQDVDAEQYRLLTLVAPPGSDVCVIGDPDQAIYGFRGADAGCFDRFMREYPHPTVVRLTRNYRSSGTIVRASSQVVRASPHTPADARVARKALERITIHTAPTERAEAEHVVQAIEQMIGGHTFFSIDSGRASDGARADLSFADFAVLYRTAAQSAALCEALERSGMPFQKHGHEPLMEQPGVATLLRELDAAGASGAGLLSAALADAARRVESQNAGADPSQIQRAARQLAALAQACGQDRERFADTLALATDADGWDPRADRVSLLTLHAAKGLEFPVVFIVGLEDGILPLRWGDRLDPATTSEERGSSTLA